MSRESLLICYSGMLGLLLSCNDRKRVDDTGRLQELYQQGLQVIYDKNDPYCPEAELAFADSMLSVPTNSPRTLEITEYIKGFALMKLGDEKLAITVLEQLVDQTKTDPADKLYLTALDYLALAYLRLGERNNCIANHGMESCIFPIRGSAIYSDGRATLEAIGIYQQMLLQDPGDLERRWLLNIAYMTLGEYPAKVPAAWLINGLDGDSSTIKVKPFRDMAGQLGLGASRNMSGGVITDDFNNDGYLDIVTSCWGLGESMHYYKNNADGTFSDVSPMLRG